jgi:3-isopropylmalate/(R)-2-methylmalate dehydratase small subunit
VIRIEPATHIKGRCLVLPRDHIDTDQIIPARFLYRSRKDGFEGLLFNDFLSQLSQSERETFRAIHDPLESSKILFAGENFGCGSSREHAVWSLVDNGFRAVIAKSFGDIFYSNAINNGLAVIRLEEGWQQALEDVRQQSALEIDLPGGEIRIGPGKAYLFEMDGFFKNMLIQGLQEVDMTLLQIDKIRSYETRTAQTYPWLQKPA